MDVLDNPVWHALAGPQATLAEGDDHARRFDRAYAPFAAVPDDPTPEDWDALRELVGPGGNALLARLGLVTPDGWENVFAMDGVQMVWDGRPVDPPDLAHEQLTTADVAAATDLVARTKPGPFAPRTIELGTYLGVKVDGELVAMAGERLHPPGYTEVSAVCTDPVFRGRGLAAALTLHLIAGITARGEIPILHAVANNEPAVRLYEHLGFRARSMPFAVLSPT